MITILHISDSHNHCESMDILDQYVNKGGSSAQVVACTGESAIEWIEQSSVSDYASINHKPKTFFLSQNFPNPFNISTQIEVGIPARSEILLQVYDIKGRHVEILFAGEVQEGIHRYDWRAGMLATGICLIELKVGKDHYRRRCLLLK